MKFSKVRPVKTPEYGTPGSAGIDFYVPDDAGVRTLMPHSDILIPSGICANIPEGYMLMGADKSGVVTSARACYNAGRNPKKDAFECSVIIGAKICDSDYQGEIHIHLINTGSFPIAIYPGMKIAQFILVPILHAALEEVPATHLFNTATERGNGGFGSTN